MIEKIPRVINYCWFGGNKLPEQYIKYIESWKKFCPEYEIVEWNEKNFDVEENKYCKEAYEAKKWAFVSDYARLKIIYDHGGIYLDTDIELLKPLDKLLEKEIGFIGFQNREQITTGLGFAALPNNVCVGEMLGLYKGRSFFKYDGKMDLTPCPVFNTVALKKCGLKTGVMNEVQELNGMFVYPMEYFNPMDRNTGKLIIGENTYMIHHYAGTWLNGNQSVTRTVKRLLPKWALEMRENIISKVAVEKMERENEEQFSNNVCDCDMEQ